MLEKFYADEEIETFIETENIEQKLSDLKFKRNKNGLFIMPKPVIEEKPFNQQRKWSCTCAWCGMKLNRDVQDSYYLVKESTYVRGLYIQERACGETCGNHLWKEKAEEWIYENGYTKYFDIKALENSGHQNLGMYE